ncbi:MAG: acyl-CoA dehydrogenase family protein, partial [Candidatus Binatia bacterium]
MDFNFSEELAAVKNLARDFADREIAPTAARDDREKRLRRDLIVKMGELGFLGCVIPEEYGGTNLGFLALALISEEIGRVHSAMRVQINMQIGPALMLLEFGSQDQKRKHIPRLTAAETLSCFAITEPNAGSDVASIATTATKRDGGYILNGTKTWISNAQVADTAVVFACTDKLQRHRGISAFYVDLNQPGVSRRSLEKLGNHATPTGELHFENFLIPEHSRIGREEEGFKICMIHLNHTRLTCAAGAVGVARAAREAAVTYANQRQQFGKKIGQFQMIQDLISQMIVHEEASRLLVYQAAWLKDQEKPNNLETSIAKYTAAEAASFAADAALKIMGAYGYSTEFPAERYLRDAKYYQIVEGSSNIQKLIIARDALGY